MEEKVRQYQCLEGEEEDEELKMKKKLPEKTRKEEEQTKQVEARPEWWLEKLWEVNKKLKQP